MCVSRRPGLSVAVCLLYVSAAAADSPHFFGPKTYFVEPGRPQTVTEQFVLDADATCDGQATFLLTVTNAGIASGSIGVNGMLVAIPKDFAPGRPPFTLPITLAANNVMTAQLTGGQSGGSVTVTIDRSIETAAFPTKTYAVTKGSTTFVEQFPLDDASGPFVLLIHNGVGANRVSAATVMVNGMSVVSASELNGTVPELRIPLELRTQNTLSVTLHGTDGASIGVTVKRVVDESACGPQVDFATPTSGSVLSTASILASGTVAGPRDVAVTVNGQLADIDLSTRGSRQDPFVWVAEVPANTGPVLLTATATTASGRAATAQRSVSFLPDIRAIGVTPSPRSGIVPLEVAFNISVPRPADVARYELDYDGDGVKDFDGAELPERVEHTYTRLGRYSPTVRCVMTDGSVVTGTTQVVVQSWETMDALLRGGWSRFVTKRALQDVESALRELSPAARAKYGIALNAIRDGLPAYAQSITGFDAVWIHGNAAHYLLRRQQEGSTFGYHVYFTRGADGVWRIEQF